MKTIHAILLLSFLAVFVASCGDNKAAENKNTTEVIPVKLLPLNGQHTGTATIAVSGQFTTDDETMLSFKTGGIIQSLAVKEGDAIKTGQVLATLNPTEINAQVTQAQLGFEKAQRDYNRVLHLYQDSVATLEQLQNTKTAMNIAEEQFKSAEFNRSHSQIRATSNGYVLRKLANEGQLVQAGTPIFETNGAAAGNWLLRVDLSNKQWAEIQAQDKATIEIESVPGKTFEGTVVRKTEGLNQTSGTFKADIRLNGAKPAAIAYGMFGKATIEPAGGKVKNQANGGDGKSEAGRTTGDGRSEAGRAAGDGKSEAGRTTGDGRSEAGRAAGDGKSEAGRTTGDGRSEAGRTAGDGKSEAGRAAGEGRLQAGRTAGDGRSEAGRATGDGATATNNGPWAIPYEALMEGDGSTGYVFITNDNKTAKKVTVTIGGMEKDQVIITKGLEQAGALIISGSAYLTDGSPISVK
ncbi:efflux RND transporter periplasmic adaptor subunit [Chitinophaga sancti]|uniref:efflux RND transporter periplasmic adaptor subunit n=1 Tax=Chitinophaga sancti TaxID=1004 RepID=UPI002A754689|nr:efflux RND transporter periplasmic adaptor subunit [Chitinophaga sancti]WPQ60761.1 efflux RND transporter periplasmic adaptor subunit [Chitinophaga sancti]